MEAVVEVNNLKAYYRAFLYGVDREVRAVDDVSLRIGRGEIYGVAGESSSGKTTLIKTIAGAIRPPLRVVSGSDRKSTRLNSSHITPSRMPSSA